jgi:hypothetical protein
MLVRVRRGALIVLLVLMGTVFSAGCSAGDSSAVYMNESFASSCIGAIVRYKFLHPQRTLPQALSTPLPMSILTRFAIFRRLASPSEKALSNETRLAQVLGKAFELSNYYPDYMREIATNGDGSRYFVIPAFGRAEPLPPAHCRPAMVRHVLVEQRRRRLIEPVFCVIEVRGEHNWSADECEPFAAIEEFRTVFSPVALGRRETIVGLVPDDVVSIRLSYRYNEPVTVNVSGNSFAFVPPMPDMEISLRLKSLASELDRPGLSPALRRELTQRSNKLIDESEPTRAEWLDSAGAVVRTINRPVADQNSATSVGNLRAPIGG